MKKLISKIFFAIAFAIITIHICVPKEKKDKGEFSIPQITILHKEELAKVRNLIKIDPEANKLFEDLKNQALPLLDIQPTPLKVIHYEGLLNTDPIRIATVEKLRQMSDAATLLKYWQGSDDPKAAKQLKNIIISWIETYKITGNDVNENKLWPILAAYRQLYDEFSAKEKEKINKWLLDFGNIHYKGVKESNRYTNRFTKRLRLLAIAGLILQKDEWIDEAVEGAKKFITNGLYPDGTSFDLEHRDTLTYHCSALVPIIELAKLLGKDKGYQLYSWESQTGSSVKKSVDYVVPYATGEKTRQEWVNSKVELDRKRTEAGIEHYQKGALFDPKYSIDLMEEASFFDPKLVDIAKKLFENDAKRFPSWQIMLNYVINQK